MGYSLLRTAYQEVAAVIFAGFFSILEVLLVIVLLLGGNNFETAYDTLTACFSGT